MNSKSTVRVLNSELELNRFNAIFNVLSKESK
ncbi:hypothetical protein Nit79A3_1957 [Nitrosomonas sp. Is79A3]